MIGMDFESFLALLILGCIAAVVLHVSVRYPTSQGIDSFFAEWMAGWIGAWLGSPVLGHWWFSVQNVYVIPALVGAFVGGFSMMYWRRTAVAAATALKPLPTVTVQPEMQRKAS